MFSDDAIQKADVQALEDSVIAEFSLDHFNTFLTANQTLALRFREYFRTLMAARQAQNDAERYVNQRKYLALVAHNNMKESLMEFCQLQRSKISEFPPHRHRHNRNIAVQEDRIGPVAKSSLWPSWWRPSRWWPDLNQQHLRCHLLQGPIVCTPTSRRHRGPWTSM